MIPCKEKREKTLHATFKNVWLTLRRISVYYQKRFVIFNTGIHDQDVLEFCTKFYTKCV